MSIACVVIHKSVYKQAKVYHGASLQRKRPLRKMGSKSLASGNAIYAYEEKSNASPTGSYRIILYGRDLEQQSSNPGPEPKCSEVEVKVVETYLKYANKIPANESTANAIWPPPNASVLPKRSEELDEADGDLYKSLITHKCADVSGLLCLLPEPLWEVVSAICEASEQLDCVIESGESRPSLWTMTPNKACLLALCNSSLWAVIKSLGASRYLPKTRLFVGKEEKGFEDFIRGLKILEKQEHLTINTQDAELRNTAVWKLYELKINDQKEEDKRMREQQRQAEAAGANARSRSATDPPPRQRERNYMHHPLRQPASMDCTSSTPRGYLPKTLPITSRKCSDEAVQ